MQVGTNTSLWESTRDTDEDSGLGGGILDLLQEDSNLILNEAEDGTITKEG